MTTQPQKKSYKKIFIAVGILWGIFLLILLISFLLPDTPDEWSVLTKKETERYVDVDIKINKPLDTAEIISIGAGFKKNCPDDKKLVIRFFENGVVVGKDLIYANMVYPSNTNSSNDLRFTDENGKKFILLFLGGQKTLSETNND